MPVRAGKEAKAKDEGEENTDEDKIGTKGTHHVDETENTLELRSLMTTFNEKVTSNITHHPQTEKAERSIEASSG